MPLFQQGGMMFEKNEKQQWSNRTDTGPVKG